MALKVTVTRGKHEPSRPAGLVRRGEAGSEADKQGQISINELVEAVFSQVRSTLENEADVEVELTANVEIVNKEGKSSINLDVSGESPNARTMRLKFSTKLNPNQEAKG